MNTDLFAHFSLSEFALVAILYTLVPFLSGARYSNLRPALNLIAKLKADPKLVLGIHVGFLCLLFGALWQSAQIYSSLPIWMTNQNSKRVSVFDLAVVIVVILMAVVEERLILKRSNVVASGE